jgi:hypothetical protein
MPRKTSRPAHLPGPVGRGWQTRIGAVLSHFTPRGGRSEAELALRRRGVNRAPTRRQFQAEFVRSLPEGHRRPSGVAYRRKF